jgi:phosphoribosylamine---glycine ligase
MRQPDKSLKVLVVGSGGREHTLASLCRKSPFCREVIAAPGNGGMASAIPCFPVPAEDVEGLVALAVREQIDFVVVGPEVPLSLGLADELRAQGIAAFGPGKAGAQLEASKIFTKKLLQKYNIPTAAAQEFDTLPPALAYLRGRSFPIVIKADGLAAGKGVIMAANYEEAEHAVRDMLEGGAFGSSGSRVLIEDCLVGEEASIHLLVSGRDFVILPTSQDHKRAGDGDTGPNTGGMGAYSPAELVTGEILEAILKKVVRPSVAAIADEGIHFVGTLYIGVMLTAEGPQVLEFNTRFGDPETQVILPRLQTDLLHLMHACTEGYLPEIPVEVSPDYSLCVVVAAGGYPGDYAKGDEIKLPATTPPDCFVYHAGTALRDDGKIVTNGGRVLGVTATARSLAEAAQKAYDLCGKIKFASMYYRRDIGAKQLNR